jgi:DNA-binding MarR family transcriptional regulator
MDRRTPTQQDYEMLAEFRATLRRFISFSEVAARKAGLTPRQHQALLAIKGSPGKTPVSIGDLAEKLRLRHNTTVELANRLTAARLALRVADPVDKRRVCLKVAPKGEARLATLSAIHLKDLRGMREVLRRLLRRIEKE